MRASWARLTMAMKEERPPEARAAQDLASVDHTYDSLGVTDVELSECRRRLEDGLPPLSYLPASHLLGRIVGIWPIPALALAETRLEILISAPGGGCSSACPCKATTLEGPLGTAEGAAHPDSSTDDFGCQRVPEAVKNGSEARSWAAGRLWSNAIGRAI